MSSEVDDRRDILKRARMVARAYVLRAGDDTPIGEADAHLLAAAVELLDDAVRHYEGAITWHTSCVHCSTLMDRCMMADRHLEETRAALAAALAREP